jgi:hypothetical protein
MTSAARYETPGAGDDGKVYEYDETANAFVLATGGGGGGATNLDGLTDVVITAAASGDILRRGGTNWVNTPGTTHFDAAGTAATAVAAHEADTTSVHGIANTANLLTTSSGIDALSDVTITAAASGDIIRHNGTAWVDAVGTTHFEVAGAVATHEADTTSVHGIADTSALVTTSSAPELIRDTMATALVQGSGVTITVNDGADTITIAASGGTSQPPRWQTGYVSGSYYTPQLMAATHSTFSWGLNQLWFVPFYAVASATFDRMQVYLGATANARLGFYAADGAGGRPGTLISDAGVIAGTGAGDKTLTISQALTANTWYWLGIVLDTTVTIGICPATALLAHAAASPAAGTVYGSFYRAFTYGALPATAGTLIDYTTAPCIELRAA